MARQSITARDIAAFRDALVAKNPAIRKYLPEMGEKPFFLLAATGLGKTVVVPAHLAEMLLRKSPGSSAQLWVVEPKIFIAQDMAFFLNGLWQEFCHRQGWERGPLFGCKTKVDDDGVDAPVIFCTTGIFSIYARNRKFRPGIDGVLIDEAHDTLETDHAMELGVALCRFSRVRTDFMSATVEERCLRLAFPDVRIIRADEKRHPVWRHNTRQPMGQCLTDVVEQTLLNFDPEGPYAPPPEHPGGEGVTAALTEQGRSRGLLVIVTSCSGAQSDAQRAYRQLQESRFADKVDVVLLSGETRRDPALREQFDAKVERWKREAIRYVVIATSVVEMGVTLPNLDIVVTTDEGINGDADGPLKRGPLGVNALMQRAGRTGRQRPGLLVITRDARAQYSSLDDAVLNEPVVMAPEAIRFPMRHGDLSWLAYHACEAAWEVTEAEEDMTCLRLPSCIHEHEDRVRDLVAEMELLHRYGAADMNGLTPLGRHISRWIGRVNPTCAAAVMQAYATQDELALLPAIQDCVMRRLLYSTSSQGRALSSEDVAELFFRHTAVGSRVRHSRVVSAWREEDVAEDAEALNADEIDILDAAAGFDEILGLLGETTAAERLFHPRFQALLPGRRRRSR